MRFPRQRRTQRARHYVATAPIRLDDSSDVFGERLRTRSVPVEDVLRERAAVEIRTLFGKHDLFADVLVADLSSLGLYLLITRSRPASYNFRPDVCLHGASIARKQ